MTLEEDNAIVLLSKSTYLLYQICDSISIEWWFCFWGFAYFLSSKPYIFLSQTKVSLISSLREGTLFDVVRILWLHSLDIFHFDIEEAFTFGLKASQRNLKSRYTNVFLQKYVLSSTDYVGCTFSYRIF